MNEQGYLKIVHDKVDEIYKLFGEVYCSKPIFFYSVRVAVTIQILFLANIDKEVVFFFIMFLKQILCVQ